MLNIKKSLLAGSAILAMGVSTASLAAYGLPETPAPVSNYYIGLFGGLTYTPSINDVVNDIEFNVPFNNPNWDIGAHFGYRWDPVRLELEYLFQRSALEQTTNTSAFNTTDVSGHINAHSAMANVLYDINIDSSIMPYIGFGIGYTSLSASATATFTDPVTGATSSVSNTGPSESRFGYQALAGIGFRVWDNSMFNLGYRYFGTNTGDGGRFQNHLFNVGFDYYFM